MEANTATATGESKMNATAAKENAADCRRWAEQSHLSGDDATAAMWREKANEFDGIAANARSYAARNRELSKRIANRRA